MSFDKYKGLGNFNLVKIDTVQVQSITSRYKHIFQGIPFKTTQKEVFSKYKGKVIPIFKDTTFAVNVFSSKRVYEIMTSFIHMDFFLKGRPIPISKKNKKLVNRSFVTPEDGYFLNHESKVVVGDTLYTFNDTTYTKSNIVNGSSKEISLNYVKEDPPGTGGGGGTTSPSPCEGYNSPSGIKAGDADIFFIDEVVTDTWGDKWDVRLTYGNASYTDIIRRSRTITGFTFLEHDPDDRGHLYEGKYRYWYSPPDLPQLASNRFPNSSVDAEMKFESRIGLELTCRERNRGDEGEFKAERIKGRCPNTGVVSWHNAKLGSQIFLNNVCVN